jgi:hypothetical protein
VVAVDPRFHVSKAAFVALLKRAERLWEVPFGRDLLRYQPGGDVKVSLVYDDRTVAYLRRAGVEKTVDADDVRITALRAGLDERNRELERRKAEIDTRNSALDKRVGYWNARGGAPAKLYDMLRTERDAISRLVTAYNRDLAAARQAQASFNALVSARNAVAKGTHGAEVELGQATVGGTEMEIFALTGNRAKDATLVAHEFGHILGLEHIPGAGNIMNPYLVKALSRASARDLGALTRICDR